MHNLKMATHLVKSLKKVSWVIFKRALQNAWQNSPFILPAAFDAINCFALSKQNKSNLLFFNN